MRLVEVAEATAICACTTTELIVTVVAVTADAGPRFEPSVTELALSRREKVPSVVHVTVTVIDVPTDADTDVTEHVAVPEAFTKSEVVIPETLSEKAATKVKVREALEAPAELIRVAVGAITSTIPPVKTLDDCEGSPLPFAFTARISTR